MDRSRRSFVAVVVVFQSLTVFWFGPSVLSQPAGIFTDVKNLGPVVNSRENESASSISQDGLTLYFQSQQDLGQFEIFRVSREQTSDEFGNLEHLAAIGSPALDGGPCLSVNGLTLYFFSNRTGGDGSLDLWMATRENTEDEFTDPVPVEGVNTPADEAAPYVTGDELTIYFRRFENDNWDIFRASRTDKADAFGAAEKLGPGVNTAFSERFSRLSADGLFLFFDDLFGSRPGGEGGDIWLATRPDADAAFGDATNLLPGINSPSYEANPNPSPQWPADGSILYFSSNRPDPGAQGAGDLYQATWIANPPVAHFTVTPEDGPGPLEVELDAGASTVQDGHTILSYAWDFGDGENDQGTDPVVTHTYQAFGAFTIRLTITSDDRDLTAEAEQVVVVSLAPGDVLPWTSEDVGAPASPGVARLDDVCLLIAGAEGDLGRNADTFHFVHQRVAGNFELKAQITEWDAETRNSKLGLMLRAGLEADAVAVTVALDRQRDGFLHRFFRRTASGGLLRTTNHDELESPAVWLRVQRRGNEVSGSISVDGDTWSDPDTVDLPDLPDEVYAGIASSWVATTAGDPAPVVATLCDLTLGPPPELPLEFLRGDCDGDGDPCSGVNDALQLLGWLFLGDAEPPCRAACDPDKSGELDLADAVYGLNFCFMGDDPPAAPFPECGPGTETDLALGCEAPVCP